MIKFRTHGSFSSTFLQMNYTWSGLSMFLLTYSNDGRLAQAINLATFLILWSGSSIKNTYSVITKNTSTTVFFRVALSTDLFNYCELSFSSLQWKNAHYGLPVHILVSYCMPRWNCPTTASCPVYGFFCCPFAWVFNVSIMKSGKRMIRSNKFIDGRQSSSFLGMICISKSLPSAKDGDVNYTQRFDIQKGLTLVFVIMSGG